MTAGALGGLAAGTMMSGVMMAASKTGIVEEPLPLKVEHWAERKTGFGKVTSSQQEQMLAQAGHFALSAGLGAAYGLLHARTRSRALPTGLLFGLGIYALNLIGIGPTLGITRGPWRESTMTVARRVMMHALYGTVTALIEDRARKRLH